MNPLHAAPVTEIARRPLVVLALMLAAASAGAQQGSVSTVTVDSAAMQPLPPLAPPASAASARSDAAVAPAPVVPEPADALGGSTRQLLALQRGGSVASPVPRPLPGEIAQRSRERYLKSFEYPIPERFQSSVTQKPGSTR